MLNYISRSVGPNKVSFFAHWSLKQKRWFIELQSTLKMIIGAKGIALDYVISQNDMPDPSYQANYEERARLAAPRSGNTYILDALAVHGVTLRNIAESSDA